MGTALTAVLATAQSSSAAEAADYWTVHCHDGDSNDDPGGTDLIAIVEKTSDPNAYGQAKFSAYGEKLEVHRTTSTGSMEVVLTWWKTGDSKNAKQYIAEVYDEPKSYDFDIPEGWNVTLTIGVLGGKTAYCKGKA